VNTIEEQYTMLNEEMIVEDLDSILNKARAGSILVSSALLLALQEFPEHLTSLLGATTFSAGLTALIEVIIAYRYYKGAKQRKLLQGKNPEEVKEVAKIANKKFDPKIEKLIAKRKSVLDRYLEYV